MRDHSDSRLFVKPSAIDYRQSDCSLIDRDKLLVNRGYVPYDASSFENPEFKKMLEQQEVANLGKAYEIDLESK